MSSGKQSSGATPAGQGGGSMAPGPTESGKPPTDEIVHRRGGGHTGLYVVVAIVVVLAVILSGAYATGYLKFASKSTSSCSGPASSVVPANSGQPAPAAPSPAFHPESGQTVSGAGSTLVQPLMATWETAYTNNTLYYSGVGSTAGINDILGKTVDFGASDAPMNPTQRSLITTPGGIDTIPESAGAAVPIYNLPTVGQTLKFTGAVLAGIYLGDITNWNNSLLQVANPGVVLPNACIIVVHRSDGSGTTFVFTSFLSKENATWNQTRGFSTQPTVFPIGIGAKGNGAVTTTVKSTPYAIGYVDINYALSNGVAFGAVQNPKGNFILASLTNIASAINDSNVKFPAANGDWYNVSVLNAPGAQDYPMATLTYVLVYANLTAADVGTSPTYITHAVGEALVDVLKWMVNETEGQSYSAAAYYVPLPAWVVASDMATIGSIAKTIPP